MTSLPEKLPNLQTLYCSRCPLSSLPEQYANLKTLNCSACLQLSSLPKQYANLQTLDCSRCPLSSLPEQYANLKTLNCSRCPLSSLPKQYANLQTLDCSRCPLSTLPEQYTGLQWLDCQDTAITSLPELPYDATVYSGSSVSFDKLEVDIDEISKNPGKYYKLLGERLLSGKPFPNVYYFKNGQRSEGIDVGGLRRDFITRLFKNVPFSHRDGPSGGVLPQCDGSEGSIKDMRTLGKVFALCVPEGSYFKLGPVFDPLLFTSIQGLSKRKTFQKLYGISDEIFELAEGSKSTDDARVRAGYILDEEKGKPSDYFKKSENREQLKTQLKERMENDSAMRAIRIIAKELKTTTGSSFEGVDLEKRIQGELTKDLLKQKLRWEGTATHDELAKTQSFLYNWIDRATDEDLSNFVWAVSSNRALGPQPLKISLQHLGKNLPVAHTCAFMLELSVEHPDQETFDSKLKWLLTDGLKSGFTIA